MRQSDYDKLRAELLDAQARITDLLRTLPDLYAELIDAMPGYPTSTGGGGAPSLDAAGQPSGLDRFVTTDHPASTDYRALRRDFIATANAARHAHHIAARWLADPVRPDGEPRARSGGDCTACGIYRPTALGSVRCMPPVMAPIPGAGSAAARQWRPWRLAGRAAP